MSEMSVAIKELIEEKGYDKENVKRIIENALKSAYKRTFGTADNAIVKFEDDLSDVAIYSRKVVVDTAYNAATEIELEDAQKLAEGVELGDEIDILIDPKTFRRSAVTTGKQTAKADLNETMRESLYAQYKDKVGTVINGVCQKESEGDVFIDIGNMGHVEAIMPKTLQSPLETYEKGDNLKCIVVKVKTVRDGVKLLLSRSDPKLVQLLMEQEIPELATGVIKIEKAVREAGYRTKIALSTTSENIDPVGACVGPKGARIQNISKELLGEKIDVLEYSNDITTFIHNSLSPARVNRVVILDEEKKEALAVVNDEIFALAIGSKGLNVRLANRLTGWSIDVKTETQAAALDLSEKATTKAAQDLFSGNSDKNTSEQNGDEATEESDDTLLIKKLPGVNTDTVFVLNENGVTTIDDFVLKYNAGDLYKIEDLDKEEIDDVYNIIASNYDIEDAENTSETEEYHCPACGAVITLTMTKCPVCGTEFEFADEDTQ